MRSFMCMFLYILIIILYRFAVKLCFFFWIAKCNHYLSKVCKRSSRVSNSSAFPFGILGGNNSEIALFLDIRNLHIFLLPATSLIQPSFTLLAYVLSFVCLRFPLVNFIVSTSLPSACLCLLAADFHFTLFFCFIIRNVYPNLIPDSSFLPIHHQPFLPPSRPCIFKNSFYLKPTVFSSSFFSSSSSTREKRRHFWEFCILQKKEM